MIVENIGTLLKYCDIDINARKFLLFVIWFPLGISLVFPIMFNADLLLGFVLFIVSSVFIVLTIFAYLYMIKNKRAELVEANLPDYLLLVANNIRSGIPPEKALMISAKKEFGVLSKEVMGVMKLSFSGKSLEEILPEISARIDSEVLRNSINLIVEGMQSGGELPSLLERTSYDLRSFESVRKDIKSVITTYELFIAAAASFAAPLLLATSTYIVQIMTSLKSRIPEDIAAGSIPVFKQSEIAITSDDLLIFSFVSIFITAFFASLAIGLMSKGKIVEGVKSIPMLVALGLALFFIFRLLLQGMLGNLIV
ncbi:MAG: type II secretion system F family protein [Candidatus Micrarchaeota archaeon]